MDQTYSLGTIPIRYGTPIFGLNILKHYESFYCQAVYNLSSTINPTPLIQQYQVNNYITLINENDLVFSQISKLFTFFLIYIY